MLLVISYFFKHSFQLHLYSLNVNIGTFELFSIRLADSSVYGAKRIQAEELYENIKEN